MKNIDMGVKRGWYPDFIIDAHKKFQKESAELADSLIQMSYKEMVQQYEMSKLSML